MPGLALDRLDQHRGRVLPHRRPQRIRVVEGNRAEAGQHRRQVGVGGERRRSGERAVGAAVEVALEADDLGRGDAAPVGVLAGDLDRALVRLGARVGEEDAAAEARLREPLGEPHHRLGVEEVRGVHQAPGLLAHRLDHLGVAVARPSRPRCRRGSRGTPCPRHPRAARPRRARTRPAPACRCASGSAARAPADRSGSWRHHRADAGVGEELEQQRVRPAAVDDVGRLAPPLNRVDAGGSLGRMPPSISASRAPRPRRQSRARSASRVRRRRPASPRRR